MAIGMFTNVRPWALSKTLLQLVLVNWNLQDKEVGESNKWKEGAVYEASTWFKAWDASEIYISPKYIDH
jgi:hypothetical protein